MAVKALNSPMSAKQFAVEMVLLTTVQQPKNICLPPAGDLHRWCSALSGAGVLPWHRRLQLDLQLLESGQQPSFG